MNGESILMFDMWNEMPRTVMMLFLTDAVDVEWIMAQM